MRRLLLGILLAAALGAVVTGSAGATPTIVTCGDTITQPGTWNVVHNCTGNGITIVAGDVVLRLNGHTLTGTNTTAGITATSVSNVQIEGPGKLYGYIDGIDLAFVNYSRVVDLRIGGSNGHGVALYDSNYNLLTRDVVTGSTFHGMTLNGSDGNVIDYDRSNGNGSVGVFLASSSGNQVAYDTLTGNGDNGLDVGDIGNGPASGNRIEHDTANGNFSYGVLLESSSSDNAVSYTKAHRNGTEDLYDLSCSNTWSHNEFGSFSRDCPG
jgi:parallel beta-helix repeat protein